MLDDVASALGSLWTGRNRYLAATKVGLALEQSYRNYRNQAEGLPILEQRRLLAKTHHQGAVKVRQLFHENGAIWVKFGQFLSSRTDILPIQYTVELEKLQDQAKPVDFPTIEQVLLAEWGDDWKLKFSQFEPEAVAAASVAQVHRAMLATGERVAVKVQLPHARQRFKEDSAIFKMVAAFGANMVTQFDLKQVASELIAMTMKELDFLQEEDNHRKFAGLPHPAFVHVPKLYEDLSTGRVLVTEWIDGVKLTDFLNAKRAKAEMVLRQLLTCYVTHITTYGVYHADPHPGNFLVMNDGARVAILDYGAIGVLTPEETQNYGDLLRVIFGKMTSSMSLGELFRRAGFEAENQGVFEEVAELILKESLNNAHSSDILSHALDKMRDLKVRIPDSFVSLARVILTFSGLLKTYGVKP